MMSGVLVCLVLMKMRKRSDNMLIPLGGYKHGRYFSNPHCIANHLRPLDYDFGSADIVRTWVLDDVGANVGEGRNTSNFQRFRLSSSTQQRGIK